MHGPPTAPIQAPSRVRYRVLALVCGLSMVTYLDRVCFGTAAPLLAGELGFADAASLKWAFTAFAIAYALFEVPAGWLGDRYGPRGTLLRIVVWWSACTALTGAVGLRVAGLTLGGLGTLVVLRFLFGAGEAGAYPNITRAIHNWFPAGERDLAQSLVWMSGRLMGGLTPLVWAVLVGQQTAAGGGLGLSWRTAFAAFGILGLAWCALFALTFHNRPADHPDVNAAELAHIGSNWQPRQDQHAIPWRAMLRSRGLWAVCTLYFLVNYGWVFHITYLPGYLDERFRLDRGDLLGALYKGAPLWVGAIGCLAGGLVVTRLSRMLGGRRQGRRALGVAALLGCAVCWAGARATDNLHVFCGLISLAALGIDLTLGATWATCHDLGRRSAAVTAATMNTIGTLGSAVAAWLTGTLVEHRLSAVGLSASSGEPASAAYRQAWLAGYETVFATYALVYLLAAGCWLLIDPDRPIDTEDETGPQQRGAR